MGTILLLTCERWSDTPSLHLQHRSARPEAASGLSCTARQAQWQASARSMIDLEASASNISDESPSDGVFLTLWGAIPDWSSDSLAGSDTDGEADDGELVDLA